MSATKGAAQLDIDFERRVFAVPTHRIRGLVRGSDPLESQAGAVRALNHQTRLQQAILHIIATEGSQTAKEVEARVEMRGYGPSSVRKRFSELRAANRIVQVEIEGRKQRREGCAVWDLAPTVPPCP